MANGSISKPPLLSLVATPGNALEIPSFFSESDNPIFSLLENPKYLRYTGWNLQTLDHPRIKDGKAWEVNNGDAKTIRIYSNGSLVTIALANQEFLGWGREELEFQQKPFLNSLGIVEYMYELVAFYKEMLRLIEKPKTVKFSVGLENVLLESGKTLQINPAPVSSNPFFQVMTSPYPVKGDFFFEKEFPILEDVYPVSYVSYSLIEEFFIRFSVPSDKIPYVSKDSDGKRFIDTKLWMKPGEVSGWVDMK